MCHACWESHGSPTELPWNWRNTVDLIEELYEQPDGATGGPLHVVLDDFNIEDRCIVVDEDYDYRPETVRIANDIAANLLDMTEPQRAAVLARWEGWFKE